MELYITVIKKKKTFGMINKKETQKERIDKIQENSRKGILSFFPYNFKIFNKFVPGMIIEPTIITANSSGGKSSLMKFLYIIKAVELAIEKNLTYHLLLFALEDDEMIIRHTILCYLYWETYNDFIDIKLLEGARFNDNGDVIPMTPLQIQRKNELLPYVDKYMEYITIFDDIYDVDEIHHYVMKFAFNSGEFYIEGRKLSLPEVLTNVDYDYYKKVKYEHVAVAVDHVGLLNESDNYDTLYKCIGALSKIGKQLFVKKLGYHWLMVQQQSEETNDLEHIKSNYFLPTLQGLSDRKSTGKDSRLSLGVVNPSKYGLKKFNGYNMELMKGYYRAVSIIKQTMGITDMTFNCLFIPYSCSFYLLPPVKKDEEVPEKTLDFIKNILLKIKEYEGI